MTLFDHFNPFVVLPTGIPFLNIFYLITDTGLAVSDNTLCITQDVELNFNPLLDSKLVDVHSMSLLSVDSASPVCVFSFVLP